MQPITMHKGKAPIANQRASLWGRNLLQEHFVRVGYTIHKHSGKILFVGLLAVALLCLAFKSAQYEYNLEKLWLSSNPIWKNWTETEGNFEENLKHSQARIGLYSAGNEQLVIQTERSGANILNEEALLVHYKLLRRALEVEVELFDQQWSLRDICLTLSVSNLGRHELNQKVMEVMPCLIVTPLTCFWEGSTLNVGKPSSVVLALTSLLNFTKQHVNHSNKPVNLLESFMSRSGITPYEEKPCLDPYNRQCPDAAPNKRSRTIPDIGMTLTGGCYDFARNLLHWSENLTIGGIERDSSDTVVRATALQSSVQIMDDEAVFEAHMGAPYMYGVDWTIEKAHKVVETWQKRFAQEMRHLSATKHYAQKYSVITFTSNSLEQVIRESTPPNLSNFSIGVSVLLAVQCVPLVLLNGRVSSQLYIAFIGMFIHGLSTSAGFGLCAGLFAFNVTTLHVLPVLSLVFGGNCMFIVAHGLNKVMSDSTTTRNKHIAECLKLTGAPVALSSIVMVLAFTAGSIIPIPALHDFAVQGAIVHACSAIGTLYLFPAACNKVLCRLPMATRDAESKCGESIFVGTELGWYASLINHSFFQSLVILSFLCLSAFGFWGSARVEYGSILPDVIPADTTEYEFLRLQDRYFATFRIFANAKYWAQYHVDLQHCLELATTIILTAAFIMVYLALRNFRAAILILFVLSFSMVSTYGVLHTLGMTLDGISAILIVISVGLGVDSMVCFTSEFLRSAGVKEARVCVALNNIGVPMVYTTMMRLVGVSILVYLGSQFGFIVTHFFYFLSAVWAIYAYNSLVALPVLLSFVGPSCELAPENDPVEGIRVTSPQLPTIGVHSALSDIVITHSYQRRGSLSTIREEDSMCMTPELMSIEPSSTSVASEFRISIEIINTADNSINGQDISTKLFANKGSNDR